MTPYILAPDDFKVNDFVTIISPENCVLHGSVLEILHVEFPLVILQLHINWNGERVKDSIFPMNIKGMEFKKLSDEYIKVLLRNPTPPVVEKVEPVQSQISRLAPPLVEPIQNVQVISPEEFANQFMGVPTRKTNAKRTNQNRKRRN